MSGHAYFGVGEAKIKHVSFCHNGEMKKIRKAWLYKNGVYTQVWSGASVVSYYDGNTLIGIEEVDEGEDVLHPSLSTAKENYTLVGWKQAVYGDKVLELNATGEPMVLYAMYLPNTYNAVSDSTYVTGGTSTSASATPFYQGGWDLGSSTSFVLNMREYQNNSVTVVQQNIYSGHLDDDQPWGYGQLDGSDVAKNSSRTFTNIANGTHVLRTIGHTANEAEARNTQTLRCYVASIVLSNPTPWT